MCKPNIKVKVTTDNLDKIECINSGWDDGQPFVEFKIYLKSGEMEIIENWTNNRMAADIEDGVITEDICDCINNCLEYKWEMYAADENPDYDFEADECYFNGLNPV